MTSTPTSPSPLTPWCCTPCGARLLATAPPPGCPWCGQPLARMAGRVQAPDAPVLAMRHDRAAFVAALMARLAALDVPDEVIATLELPVAATPLYVPFARTDEAGRGWRCLAPGLGTATRERIAAALAMAPRGLATGAPAGALLLAPASAPPPDAWVPLWRITTTLSGRALEATLDAAHGGFELALAPAADAVRATGRIDVLGHWAWLPAVFCALLAGLVDAPAVRGLLALLGVATLAGGYYAAAELRQALRRDRHRLGALDAADAPGLRRDQLRALGRLQATQRRIGWLPAAYAGVAVLAHLGVTAYVAHRAAAVHAGSPEAASLVPWSPVASNLVASPLAPAGSRLAATAVAGALAAPATIPPAGSGRVLRVAPEAYGDLAAAVAAAAPGDTIRIAAGRYAGPRRLTIDKDLAIEGEGEVTFVWHGGRGPFIRFGGRGTRVSLSHLRFEAYDINTAVLGDGNVAYGEPPAGADQTIRLCDVAIDSPQASAIYSTSPGARYEVEGGRYTGAGSAIIVVDGAALSIRPYGGAPTRVGTDGSSGVAHNGVGLTVRATRLLSIEHVQWLGDPGGDIAIQGDAVAVNVGPAARPGVPQRVLLVDEHGERRAELDTDAEAAALHFSIQHGTPHPLAGNEPQDPSLP